MSWQDYVDNQLLASQCVTKACIAGHDGNIWAQSKDFEVSFPIYLDNVSKIPINPRLANCNRRLQRHDNEMFAASSRV